MNDADQLGTHPRDYGYYDGEPETYTLKNEKCGMLAMLVHAHLVHAGREPRGSSMFVAWADDDAHLKILAPGKDGSLERVTLPNHMAVEDAIAARFAAGSLDVAFGEDFPDQRPAGSAAIASFADDLGIEPAHMGLANLPDDRSHGERIVDAVVHVIAPDVPAGSYRRITINARPDEFVARLHIEDWSGNPRGMPAGIPHEAVKALEAIRGEEGGRKHTPLWAEPNPDNHVIQARVPAAVDAMPRHLANAELDAAIRASQTADPQRPAGPRHDPAILRALQSGAGRDTSGR